MEETWFCDICHQPRPDSKISVRVKPLVINKRRVGDQNVKYCNDNPDCIEKSKSFVFFEERIRNV